ncbi:Hypothetical protein, putative [Bodo saltans]|uniref:ZZ-type domain-containing protein n=1 Tax=Bodo saltans TaxID=75058 RepID=A0A0S4JDR0_BODSA|nr:Hypothetical protein, putative [Bodo saltans]|eukprot:CUG88300.1 Hypothetical protein, putative [Bodo saltans]
MSSRNLSRQQSSIVAPENAPLLGGLSERLMITPSPVTTPVAWTNAMSYERVEFVSILQEWLRLKVFQRDDITISESHRFFCSVGLPPTKEHVLCLSGKAARTREPLYLKLVRHIRHTMVSDLEVDVRFGTQIGDRLPFGLRVTPLLETPHMRAARYWRRAFWAMRAGIVRKIAETRAMAQQRINASSGPASSSAAKRQTALYRPAGPKPPSGGGSCAGTGGEKSFRFVPASSRPLIPMSTYHTECAASSINLDRLTLNTPTLIIVWASWDAPSVTWLEEYVFPLGGGGSLVTADGGPRVGPPVDPWVMLVKRYLFVPEKTTWASVMASRGFFFLIIVWASWDAPSVMEYVFPLGGGGSLVSADGGPRVGPPVDPWVTLVKRYLFVPEKTTWASVMASRGRHPKRTTSPQTEPATTAQRETISPLGSEEDALVPSLCKRGNIVLVNVDSDLDAANAAMQDFQRRSRFWTSSEVSMSSVWVGSQGMQSELAVNLDVHNLPMIAACDPPERPGAAPIVKELDNGELAREAVRRKSSIRRRVSPPSEPTAAAHGGTVNTTPSLKLGLPMWHDVPRAERDRLLNIVAATVTSHDAPLILESVVNIAYPAENEDRDQTLVYEMESDLLAYGVKSSKITLRGSCCRTVIFDAGPTSAATAEPTGNTRDAIYAIAKRVRNSEVVVEMFSPSVPLVFTFDELTPEHRVKGAYWSVTCTHCRKSIRTEKEAHYRCLHCVPSRQIICIECYENRLHASHHVCVKLRHDTSTICQDPPLWGSSNVGVLPSMHGKVLTSASTVHHDAICNGCKSLIDGGRWKCCCCHEFELCSKCEAVWWASMDGSGAAATSQHGGSARAGATAEKSKVKGWVNAMLSTGNATPAHTTPSAKPLLSSSPAASCVLEHSAAHYMLHIRAPLVGDAGSFLHPACDMLEF